MVATAAQVKVISYDPSTVVSGVVDPSVSDNIFEGTPVFFEVTTGHANIGNGNTAGGVYGLALNACSTAEAAGTFANGNFGQQYIGAAKSGRIVNITGTPWTINTPIYVNATGNITQTAALSLCIGMVISAYEAVFNCQVTAF